MKTHTLLTLFIVSVLWRVTFTPDVDGRTVTYTMSREFSTLPEARRFVKWHPKGQYWCESERYGGTGLCELSDFEIRGE